MNWDKRYKVDVAFIDDQHQEWFSRVAKLGAAIDEGKANAEMAATLKYIVAYTQKHFADEEAYMERIQYPGQASQKKLHRTFEKYIVDVLINLKRGKTVSPVQVYEFMSNWIKQHIEEEDRQIGMFTAKEEMADDMPEENVEESHEDTLTIKLGELADLLASELIDEVDLTAKKEELLLQFANDSTGQSQADTMTKLEKLKVLIGDNLLTNEDFEVGKAQLAQAINVSKELTQWEGSKAKMIHLKKLLDESVITAEKFETAKAEILSHL